MSPLFETNEGYLQSVNVNALTSSLSAQSYPQNLNRKGLIVVNSGIGNLYIHFGNNSVSTSSYAVKLSNGSTYSMPFNYVGKINYVFDSLGGAGSLIEFF